MLVGVPLAATIYVLLKEDVSKGLELPGDESGTNLNAESAPPEQSKTANV